jgi:hypothetical protein
MVCRHCGRSKAARPRGLCWTCYQTPGIRRQYASMSKFGRRGIPDFNGSGKLPLASTTAIPGSAEKVAILQGRASRRETLWHPDDAPFASERTRMCDLSPACNARPFGEC